MAVPRRGIWGWMLFDWAAQPFFTVVTTFIFGPYFVSRLASDPAIGQAAWGYGIAVSGLIIAVLSPVLGSIADQTGRRKPWIGFFAVIKILSLIMLWFAAPGSGLILPLVFFSLASIAAEFSIVFNDSMMPRLVAPKDIGRISNMAWGLGYLGGMIVLIFVVAFMAGSPTTGKTMLGLAPIFGLDPALGEGDRATGPLSALWYLVFILPMFLFTPDGTRGLPAGRAVRAGLGELKSTLSEVRQRPGIFRFLVGRMIYQDGVNALIALGGAFAATMFGWATAEIGIFGIILNVVAIFGCLAASKLDTMLGSKVVVVISLVLADHRDDRHRLDRSGLSRFSVSYNCRAPIAADCSERRRKKPISVSACSLALPSGRCRLRHVRTWRAAFRPARPGAISASTRCREGRRAFLRPSWLQP